MLRTLALPMAAAALFLTTAAPAATRANDGAVTQTRAPAGIIIIGGIKKI